MISFLALRIARIPLIAFGVVTIVFLIFKAVPGDEASLLAGGTATQAEVENVRRQLGLDRPILEQYVAHIARLARGDLGYSITFRGNPRQHIIDRLPATLALMGAAIGLTILVGIPTGLLAAVFRGRWPDLAISFLVVGLLAVPNFWLGMVLITLLAVDLRWLPAYGFTGWASLVMPTLALSARLIALIARMTRGVVIEELGKDYVRTARSKGLDGITIVVRHVLRNAMIPTVTVLGLQSGYLLGGSVVMERLFAWPGIGDLMINAIGQRDYTLVQGITILFVVGFLIVNLIVEVLYVLINPRLRHA